MLYLNKNQNNVLKIKLSDSYINNYSGNYIFNFKNILSDSVTTLALTDDSIRKNVYSEFNIPSGSTNLLDNGQHLLNIFDSVNPNNLIYTDIITVDENTIDSDVYYVKST
jgi:hypothetical protein